MLTINGVNKPPKKYKTIKNAKIRKENIIDSSLLNILPKSVLI